MELIIKGFIIGIGKIIPGVSGSMLAISLGIYEPIIEKIANLKEDINKNIIYLIKICTGVIISIIISSKVIAKCINEYYFATMLLFIGLISGGFPNIIKRVKLKKKNIIISILTILIIGIILNNHSNNTHIIEYTLKEFITIVGIGIIDAVSSIVPGISGTAILMMLGYYNVLIESFGTILVLKRLILNIYILTPFIFGFIIGIIIMSKILNKLIKNHKNMVNTVVLILMVSTTIPLIKNIITLKPTKTELMVGILLFITGIIISVKLEKKNTTKKE